MQALLTSVDQRAGPYRQRGGECEERAKPIFAAEMATITFSKWHGTGNDFILVDDRQRKLPEDAAALARKLCMRHFGIGSDGLILLRPAHRAGTDFHMEFLNPDGSRSFCGNGSRCAFAFHSRLAGALGPVRCTAIDGEHRARWIGDEVEVSLRDVHAMERLEDGTLWLNTGSPHLLVPVADPAAVDLVAEAHKYRYGPRFSKEGINVNFVRWHQGHVQMRTYERGVEAETLSCGTGVTAAALWAMAVGLVARECAVSTPGGKLRAMAAVHEGGFAHVFLQGPVAHVFDGQVKLPG